MALFSTAAPPMCSSLGVSRAWIRDSADPRPGARPEAVLAARSRASLVALRASADPAPNSLQATGGEDAKTPLERVSDDPVLRQRAEKKEAWSAPKASLGEQVVDILYVYGGLLDRPFGSGQMMAAAGSVVVERVRAEVNAALAKDGNGVPGAPGPARGDEGGPSPSRMPLPSGTAPLAAASPQEAQRKVQVCFEILRVMQLLSVDLELLRATVKEETLLPRLEAAKDKCRTAMSLARQL